MDIKDLLCTKPQQTDTDKRSSFYVNPDTPTGSPRHTDPASDISSSESLSPPTRVRNRQYIQTRVPWRPEEDHLLRQGYEQGLSWALISARYLPHRSRGCCWGRFKTLQTSEIHQREWHDKEDQLLCIAMKKHAKLFKQAWKAVAVDVSEHRSWRECRQRAYKINMHDQKFV
jgi:Myb-like DNA-binding domain